LTLRRGKNEKSCVDVGVGGDCHIFARRDAADKRERCGMMDSFIIGLLAILGGFAVIYVIAVKLGNMDDTGSDSDSAEESLGSNDSEEHTAGGMARRGDTVTLKPRIWVGMFFSSVCLWLSWQAFNLEMPKIAVHFFVALGIIVLVQPFTVRKILGHTGITEKVKISFCGFTIYDKSRLIPWSAVSHIVYRSFLEGRFSPKGFCFYYTKPRKARPLFKYYNVLINFTLVNYKEGLEYAVKKIPKDKWAEDAQDKLKKLGILDWE
jgi:hypothetical protein